MYLNTTVPLGDVLNNGIETIIFLALNKVFINGK
jgi:hypothetical protein